MSPDPWSRRLVRAEQVLLERTRRVAVVLECAQDPHNVHAVLRTCEALGVQDVHLVAPLGEAGLISPGITQRAHDWLTIRRHATFSAAERVLRDEGRLLWAAANAAEAAPLTGALDSLPPDARLALLLGNETEGLSAAALAAADAKVRIDLVGFSASLNLSVAAGMFLWELRRRDVVRHAAGDLSPAEQSVLREAWARKLASHRSRPEEWVADALARAGELRAEALRSPRLFAEDR